MPGLQWPHRRLADALWAAVRPGTRAVLQGAPRPNQATAGGDGARLQSECSSATAYAPLESIRACHKSVPLFCCPSSVPQVCAKMQLKGLSPNPHPRRDGLRPGRVCCSPQPLKLIRRGPVRPTPRARTEPNRHDPKRTETNRALNPLRCSGSKPTAAGSGRTPHGSRPGWTKSPDRPLARTGLPPAHTPALFRGGRRAAPSV